jgi:hypothetical protein
VTAKANIMDVEQTMQADGFLTRDHLSTLDVSTQNVEAVRKAIAIMRRPPDDVVVVDAANGRSEVRVRYNAGTPVDLFKKLLDRLQVIERRNG